MVLAETRAISLSRSLSLRSAHADVCLHIKYVIFAFIYTDAVCIHGRTWTIATPSPTPVHRVRCLSLHTVYTRSSVHTFE